MKARQSASKGPAPKRTTYNPNSKAMEVLPADPNDYITAVYDDASRTLVLFGPNERIAAHIWQARPQMRMMCQSHRLPFWFTRSRAEPHMKNTHGFVWIAVMSAEPVEKGNKQF